MTALLLTLVGQLGVVAQTKIAVITDTHVLAPELLINGGGTAWQNEVNNDRKLIDYSQEVFDYLVDKFKTDKPDLLLISGDLTKDGEKVSHQYVLNGLNELKAAGVKVYVIPGNHDIDNPNAKAFDGDKDPIKVENINSATFASIYADYGYTGTERDPNSLSYACEPITGLVLLGIDSHSGSLSDATLDWVCQQANKAWKEGKQVIAMMHHLLFPHVLMGDQLIPTYNIANYETVRNRLADAGVRVILTGHMHISDIAMDWNADLKKTIYDVNTGSTISYPCDYRIMTLSEDMQTLDITTGSVTKLPSDANFGNTAKTRLYNSIKKILTDKANSYGADLISLANFFYGNLVDNTINDAANAVIIHAEGNEYNATINGKSATQYYIGVVDNIKSKKLIASLIQSKLKDIGLTWDNIYNVIHSLMDDKSHYGTNRENNTDDRTLSISMPDLTEGLKLAGDGWSTYCSERRLDLTMTEGITGYIIESVTNRAVQLKEVKVVPAETGFIVNGDQSATLRLKATDGDADNVSGNLLTGTLTAMAAPANSYVLSTKNGQTGFFPVKAGLNIPANKAYLTTTTGGNARQLVMPSGETTGISETVNPAAEQSIYTLQGVQVDKASKGIFVKNGKLIIIK